MNLSSPLDEIKGVGEALSNKLAIVGVHNVFDLINYYPRRYDDYSQLTPIAKLQPGNVSIQAVIKQAKGRYVRRGMHITEAVASDESGSVRLVWFNQPYRAASLKQNQKYFISGNFQLSNQRFSITNPAMEMATDFPTNAARILAIYKETKGLNSRQIRLIIKKVEPLMKVLPENLPKWLIKDQKLISHSDALVALHGPKDAKEIQKAEARLGFEEVFQLSLASLMNKQENESEESLAIEFKPELAKKFVSNLPFKLTDDQRKTIWQIYKDIDKSQPMNRLVEGDVGSGKTVVAAMAAIMAITEGKRVALMAPTELLARQHAETIAKLLEPMKLDHQVLLLTGSMKKAQKERAREAIKSGEAGFIIGTQALIQEKVNMKQLALIVVDEQHRFGVEQRKTLMSKAGHMPHVLSLTATPIPRSLALTLYGEMDVSILAEKPVGRQIIETKIVTPSGRARLYKQIDEQLEAGRQAFIVCPQITSTAKEEKLSAEAVYERLSKHEFKHRRVCLMHGKLSAVDKQAVMEQFVKGEMDIMVSTTVVEVGIDVPNATIMLIEAAERFGLAQLHQLRGRVGRGAHQGFCYLLPSEEKMAGQRLRALTSSNDGFKLAELDLRLRGPGAIYGIMQHGALDLRIAKLSDMKLISSAREAAKEFMAKGENLSDYKELEVSVNRLRTVTNLN